ncbi:hypothetical protein [Mesorhizobium sp. KR1-2]|uniref:hypothetical protein n=1 Tax=Mesorhizobium sp. KR1-2 TaxID=3156609 RepID=UPI0032B6244A
MDTEAIENEELEGRVQAVVEQWGESFETVARNDRFEFGGDEIRIRLWKKIKVGGIEVDRLTMVEPSLDDLMKLDNVRGDIAQTRRLIVSACSVTDREAGQIGMRDMGLIGQLAKAFTAAAPATGSTL